ncbi:MAG: thioesterase family protein [Pseudomonadota bacterium]|nr:thioesterase family protein [Pseudomonadota bacterium]
MQVPFKSQVRSVEESWIDYNGHMNVTFYTKAFDIAVDEFLESEIGIGPSSVKSTQKGSFALQTQYRYLRELQVNESFFIETFVADYSEKQIHLMLIMKKCDTEALIASCETILLNVDLNERKSSSYEVKEIGKITELFDSAEVLRSTISMGHSIGLRKSRD